MYIIFLLFAERRRYQKDSSSTDDIVTTLIHLVRQNPVLYNYKLQPNQRRRSDILNGWAQIAAAIGSKCFKRSFSYLTTIHCKCPVYVLKSTYSQKCIHSIKFHTSFFFAFQIDIPLKSVVENGRIYAIPITSTVYENPK